MNIEERLSRIEAHLKLTDEHSPEVVRPKWEAIPQQEKDAGWWRKECRKLSRENAASWLYCPRNGTEWFSAYDHRIVKTEKHPDHDRHARVKLEWDKVKDKGTHELWAINHVGGPRGWFDVEGTPTWAFGCDYEIRPIAKKMIDKSKLPIGAMTNWGKIVEKRGKGFFVYSDEKLRSMGVQALRIVPMTQWEVLQDGDVIPEGLVYRSKLVAVYGGTITIFKILGIKEGYTDE